MGRRKASNGKKESSGANLGFEEKLWAAADAMRGHMDAGEYKHVALGLIFLKYISDALQSVVKLLAEMIEPYKRRVFDPCCGSGSQQGKPASLDQP
jgi:type I restriction-modification system DNA methylase subunit